MFLHKKTQNDLNLDSSLFLQGKWFMHTVLVGSSVVVGDSLSVYWPKPLILASIVVSLDLPLPIIQQGAIILFYSPLDLGHTIPVSSVALLLYWLRAFRDSNIFHVNTSVVEHVIGFIRPSISYFTLIIFICTALDLFANFLIVFTSLSAAYDIKGTHK